MRLPFRPHLLALLAFAAACRAAPPPPPNVLLVSIDSLRADHVHSYGYGRQTTPTLDALAAEGARFATVVSPTSWTLPAHLTLLTALPPERHGVVADGQRLTDDALFLSEVLWRDGYTTAGFVAAPYLDAAFGFAQGFDHYDDHSLAKRSFDASHHGVTGPRTAALFADWLRDWRAGGARRPFFAFVHLWDVHYDYAPPPPYDRLFDPDYQGHVTADDYEQSDAVHAGMDARDLAHVVALYDGEIRFTDDTLARLLATLHDAGVLDDTIVVVTADHGEEFFEHGRKGHKQQLYDESLLVPLVIRYPARVPAGTVVPEQVRLMDVAPTILSLAGLGVPPDFGAPAARIADAAQDLSAWINAPAGQRPAPLPAFADLVGDAPVPLAAVRSGGSKLIRARDGSGAPELYDLRADPGEHANLADPARAAVLEEELSGWRQAWSGAPLSESVAINGGLRERLRALGYVR
ncbi:MAG: sulfatase [Deltaproteobacteria bacterium]|nr:sulfatase [Deltaproteobacteria bacterium]